MIATPSVSPRISLGLAGLTFSAVGGAGVPAFSIGETMRKFQVDDAGSDVRLSVELGDVRTGEASNAVLLFDGGDLWKLYETAEGFEYRFFSTIYGEGPYKKAVIDPTLRTGRIVLERSVFAGMKSVDPFEHPLTELLLSQVLCNGTGCEVHACGVVSDDGRGFLLPGQSGAGKSTIARLFEAHPRFTVLSDERLVIRRSNDGFAMFGTPWHGDGGMALPDHAALTHILFLSHGGENEISPISPGTAAARLFACGFPPFYNPRSLDFMLEFYNSVIQTVQFGEFAFLPDQSAVEFLYDRAK